MSMGAVKSTCSERAGMSTSIVQGLPGDSTAGRHGSIHCGWLLPFSYFTCSVVPLVLCACSETDGPVGPWTSHSASSEGQVLEGGGGSQAPVRGSGNVHYQ